ncbi:MAG: hypothetical protein AB1762_17560 [Gemmatimonadota bacterium]
MATRHGWWAVRVARTVVLTLGMVLAGPVAGAQSVRIQGVTSVQSVDLRPMVEDSVPIGQASGTGPYRTLADGRLVRCIDGEAFCRFRRSGDRVAATPLTQDLRAAAWGFGRGLSLHAHVRARSALGNEDFLWPRARDEFDAIEAYMQFDRDQLRIRLGRQWAANGLGLYNYDGGAVTFRRGYAQVEGFGGVSLVAGLNETHTGSILGDIDDLPPEERGYLIGVRGSTRFGGRAAFGATYQRVIMANRAGLYSERIAGDATLRLLGVSWEAGYIHDLVAGTVNEARLRAARALPNRINATLTARRHRPFFESWTIWGAFSPVAFDEVRGTLGWHAPGENLTLNARGGWRSYEETNAGLQSIPLRTDGWRAGAGAEWTPAAEWLVYGDYDVDIGFGASRSDGTAGARWTPRERTFVGGSLSLLENIYEFKVGTGRILGVRLEGGMRLASEVRAVVDAGWYSHRLTSRAPTTDWSQRRLSARLEWTVGRDPGAPVPARRAVP